MANQSKAELMKLVEDEIEAEIRHLKSPPQESEYVKANQHLLTGKRVSWLGGAVEGVAGVYWYTLTAQVAYGDHENDKGHTFTFKAEGKGLIVGVSGLTLVGKVFLDPAGWGDKADFSFAIIATGPSPASSFKLYKDGQIVAFFGGLSVGLQGAWIGGEGDISDRKP